MGKKKSRGPGKEASFEEALRRLEEIVKELEETDLPLEESLKIFEEGVRLSHKLNHKLNEAERKVEILLRNEAGEKVPVPFDPEQGTPEAERETEGPEEESDEQEGLPF
jgi:exodeoxyribonuclease VII small subunit